MITNTNMAMLTMCDFWWENKTRKHDQQCSACRGLFNKVKYIVSIIYSIHIRNNIIASCKFDLSDEKDACLATFYKY